MLLQWDLVLRASRAAVQHKPPRGRQCIIAVVCEHSKLRGEEDVSHERRFSRGRLPRKLRAKSRGSPTQYWQSVQEDVRNECVQKVVKVFIVAGERCECWHAHCGQSVTRFGRVAQPDNWGVCNICLHAKRNNCLIKSKLAARHVCTHVMDIKVHPPYAAAGPCHGCCCAVGSKMNCVWTDCC